MIDAWVLCGCQRLLFASSIKASWVLCGCQRDPSRPETLPYSHDADIARGQVYPQPDPNDMYIWEQKTKTFFFKLCILLTTVLKLAVSVEDGNKFLNMYIITCCWTLKNILRINHNNPINCFQLFSEQMYLDTFIFLKLFLQPDHFQASHKIADVEQF